MELLRQEEGTVQLRGDLHISESEELRSALIGELAANPALVLDLSGIDSCDTASFQLLCSLRKSADRDGKELRISAFSAAMHEASAILGLSAQDLTNIPKC
jgi:anti-anti-sigma factor